MAGGRGKSPLIASVRASIRVGHYSNRTVQEQLGQQGIRTTQIYTHALNRGGLVVRSPLGDALEREVYPDSRDVRYIVPPMFE